MTDTASPIDCPRDFLTSLFKTAVDVADPMRRVAQHLPDIASTRADKSSSKKGRMVVIGAGKASARMAEAVEAHYGPCEGLVITRYGYARPTQGIEIVEASHPVPDAAGLEATARMRAILHNLGPDDLVLALISGGGSSLLCAPRDGLELEDKIALNAQLLASGMPIGDMNIVRKHVSEVKGGQLAAAAFPAAMISLMISDVPGDDPAEIASGPTVGTSSTAAQARALLAQAQVDCSDAVQTVLSGESSVVAPEDPKLARVKNIVIAAPSQSLEAARLAGDAAGCDVQMLGDALQGEARHLAVQHVALACTAQAQLSIGARPLLLLSGGECTVTRAGDGVGGPNAEYVLAAALELDGAEGIHVLACDTDGVDGAAEVAGAYAGPSTLSGQVAAAQAALKNNDAHNFFASVDSQIITGPTLTNVNDFRAILIFPKGE